MVFKNIKYCFMNSSFVTNLKKKIYSSYPQPLSSCKTTMIKIKSKLRTQTIVKLTDSKIYCNLTHSNQTYHQNWKNKALVKTVPVQHFNSSALLNKPAFKPFWNLAFVILTHEIQRLIWTERSLDNQPCPLQTTE